MAKQRYGIVPPGFRTGCLPRQSKPGEWCPLFSSRIRPIPQDQWAALAQEITLRPHVKNVYNQGQVGSCASESVCQSVAIGRARANVPDVLFNPYGVYHFVNGGRDQGSTLDANLKFARESGCFPESVWSRSHGWQQRPSEEAIEAAKQHRILEFYDIRSVAEFVTALLVGFPVVYGARGHAVTGTAHLHAQKAPEIVNSWGTRWGDNGFGIWVPYSGLADMLRHGAFAVRTTTQNTPLFQEPIV